MPVNLQRTWVGIAAAAAAVVLTAAVWWPLWQGGGFIGGDVYSYYFPQKVVYAEALRAGEIPLWNNRAGHGYPLVAESQTGVFYPPNLILYRWLDVNTAYNVNHLVHYVLAFCFLWMFARAAGLGCLAAGLAGIVYTYGWFPARSCWEWAIIGGAWLPAVLWSVECFFQTRRWRYAFALTGALFLQLLAGHYNLAFITQVTAVAWISGRLWLAKDRVPPATISLRRRCSVLLAFAGLCAFALAAVQILPTWELKQISQRAAPGVHHNLGHGSIPAWYWSQAIMPWRWYAFDVNRDAELDQSEASLGAPTNQVEAHLYFGLVPLALALATIIDSVRTRNRERLFWTALGLAALFYTSSWLLPVTRYLPGFSFFQGPGRWGLITTMMVGLLAGAALDRLRATASLFLEIWTTVALCAAMLSTLILAARLQQAAETEGMQNPLHFGPWPVSDGFLAGMMVVVIVGAIAATVLTRISGKSGGSGSTLLGRQILSGCILVVTLVDLWLVRGLVRYSEIVDDPPIRHLAESPVREILNRFRGTARIFAPGANLPSVLGAASTPAYLTFGPAEYVDPQLTMPDKASPDQVAWLQRAGVTHVLSFDPLGTQLWPVRLIWRGHDRLLNPAWARREPLYLYELQRTRGRAAWADASSGGAVNIAELKSNRVVIEADSNSGGTLVLTDLMSPGWQVTIDGASAEGIRFEKMYRAVVVPPGQHRIIWTYKPRGIYWGAAIGLLAFVFLATVGHIRFWHPQRCRFLDEDFEK